MVRRNKRSSGWRDFLILVLITVISGVALKVTGNLSNPFEFSLLLMNTPAVEDDNSFQMIQLDTTTSTSQTSTVPEGRPERQSDGTDMPEMTYTLADYFAFSWDELGQVLYNLWVMMALNVIVIIVARPIGWIIKRYKQITQHAMKQRVVPQKKLSIQ